MTGSAAEPFEPAMSPFCPIPTLRRGGAAVAD
jgi:hypothetical protein